MSAGAFLGCMLAVAQMHNLPPRVLPAIQATEGGWVGAIRPNTNGTEDLGLMQVNTIWLPSVARASGLSIEESRIRLINDGCFSVLVAGAILRLHLDAERGDLMRAIGNYHSRTGSRNQAYQERVLRSATRMFGGGATAVPAPAAAAQSPSPAQAQAQAQPRRPGQGGRRPPRGQAQAHAQADAVADAQPDGPVESGAPLTR